MKNLIIALSLLGPTLAFAEVPHINCSTPVAGDGTQFKIQTTVSDGLFGSKTYVTVRKVIASSGETLRNYNHDFAVDGGKRSGPQLQITGIQMVHTGGGINGMTNFDAMTLTINTATKSGRMDVTSTYGAAPWSLRFTCR